MPYFCDPLDLCFAIYAEVAIPVITGMVEHDPPVGGSGWL
jgi:hypothetical protein